jgi:crossover junction endodeoxyribonuclease RuvC
MKKQIILGIDPGTIITGYGVIEKNNNQMICLDYGAIKPPKKEKLSRRYFIIFEAIDHLIKKYSPSAISVETQFVKNNPAIALKLGMARGACIIAAEKNSVEVFEYAPKKAKLAIVGNGGACKEQVQKMIKMLLNLKNIPEPEDAADALSLAICHLHQIDFLKKIGK